eukprot:TRINITY_DN31340_c0_g1_i2.p1 TRINITY_DN31340_c0_g1~~TRINITY_DN31340_c0_g1_i2.p1  ORF type:complete len:193 (+),score=28.76 TRINITY_DN31340_c0_g1_i2:201-779(+)
MSGRFGAALLACPDTFFQFVGILGSSRVAAADLASRDRFVSLRALFPKLFPVRVYLIGGQRLTEAESALASVECFLPGTGEWESSPCVPQMPSRRGGCAATSVQGKLFVMGGFNDEMAVLDSVSTFDTRASRAEWQEAPALLTARATIAGAAARGVVFAIGGDGVKMRAETTVEFLPATSFMLPPSESGLLA